MRRLIHAALAGAVALTGLAHGAGAQALGPFRQFLAIEPYYERTTFDNGAAVDKTSFNGYGARLWINLEPFHFIPHSSFALSGSYAPSQSTSRASSASLRTFGAEYDQFLVHRPFGGVVDPFLTAGYSRVRLKSTASAVTDKQTYNGLPLGGGIRIPLANRFQLRADAKDLILFNVPIFSGNVVYNVFPGSTSFSEKATTNNLVLQAALGITF